MPREPAKLKVPKKPPKYLDEFFRYCEENETRPVLQEAAKQGPSLVSKHFSLFAALHPQDPKPPKDDVEVVKKAGAKLANIIKSNRVPSSVVGVVLSDIFEQLDSDTKAQIISGNVVADEEDGGMDD